MLLLLPLLVSLLSLDPADVDASKKLKLGGEEYMMPDILFEARPKSYLMRMFPHLVPFQEMTDPLRKSYRYGFPPMGGRTLPTSFVIYRSASGGRKHASLESLGIPQAVLKLLLHTKQDKHQPFTRVVFYFKDLLSSKFNFKRDMIDKISDPPDYDYTNADRQFLVGYWTHLAGQSSVYHRGEKGWFVTSACDKDPVCYWQRYFLIMLSTIWVKFRHNQALPNLPDEFTTNLDVVAASFWMAYCSQLSKTDAMFKEFCPDPCRSRPCDGLANTVIDSCKVKGNSLYTNDYECRCDSGARWSSTRRRCLLFNKCDMGDHCHRIGTGSCHYDPLTGVTHCKCKRGFMGDRCEQQRNACFERFQSSSVTGNWACNVEFGNECYPLLGTDMFGCVCKPPWHFSQRFTTSDNDPNCLEFTDPCLKIVCEVGDCVSSQDGTQAVCQCPPTHYGARCHLKRGQWSPWGPWSSCDPDCGSHRLRMRNRGCLGHKCLGHRVETDWCESSDCGLPPSVSDHSLDRWRTANTLRHFLTVVTSSVAVSLLCVFLCQALTVVLVSGDSLLIDSRVAEEYSGQEIVNYRRFSILKELDRIMGEYQLEFDESLGNPAGQDVPDQSLSDLGDKGVPDQRLSDPADQGVPDQSRSDPVDQNAPDQGLSDTAGQGVPDQRVNDPADQDVPDHAKPE